MSETEATSCKEQSRGKKPYRRPELVVYGDVRTFTAALGAKGGLDGFITLKTDVVQ